MTVKTKATEQKKADEFKTAHGLKKTQFELEKKDSATRNINTRKRREDYLQRLTEFFKKYKDNKREDKKLPILPPSFLRKNIPLPSQLKKQMDEYKKMMRQNKGGRAISDKDFKKTYAKGGGVRKVRY
tara:strand:- start:222 stop:605 length:384 start_codon:yes stop_codon:yes gene_type:complete